MFNYFQEQLAAAAEHYLNAVDGKSKEFGGVTYAAFKERVTSVHTCGYFDKPAAEPTSDAPAEAVSHGFISSFSNSQF